MSGGMFPVPGPRLWVLRRCDQETGAEAVGTFRGLTAALTALVRSEGLSREPYKPELWVDPAAEIEAAATAPLEYHGGKFLYLLDAQAGWVAEPSTCAFPDRAHIIAKT
jgi:hypothetical protein